MNDEVSFLIQCYFGSEVDSVLMAIDRAYRDMVTHTLSGDQNELYSRRKAVTEYLYERISQLPTSGETYDKWHRDTCMCIKKEKYPKLRIGQIQKWVNMTVKYLYTLKRLGMDGINDYYADPKNVKKFHAPLDSYVLKHIKQEYRAWSQIDDYDNVYMDRKQKISFAEEYKMWPEFAKDALTNKDGTEKKAEKDSYKRYLQDNGDYSFRQQD